MSKCKHLKFNVENDCTPEGRLTRKANLRLHPDKNRGDCEEAANEAFKKATSECMGRTNTWAVDACPLYLEGREAVAETLLGPTGMLAAIFKNEKDITVPTYAQVKESRSNPQEPSQTAGETIDLLNSALAAVAQGAAKGGPLAARTALLDQMRQMAEAAKMEGGKGAQLLNLLYAKVSQKKGGAQAPGGQQGQQQQQQQLAVQNPDAMAMAIPPALQQQLQRNGALQVALNNATARHALLVQQGRADTQEAHALMQQIVVFGVMIADQNRRRQWLNMQRFHQIAPYVVISAGVVLAGAASYYMITTIEGAAGLVMGLGGGFIRFFVAGLIDILMAPVRRMPFGYDQYAVDGHQAMEGALAAARNYTGDDFANAAEAAADLGFGAQVTAGIILFLLFIFLEALVSLPIQNREVGVGFGLLRLGQRGDNRGQDPFLHPMPVPAFGYLNQAPAAPMIGDQQQQGQQAQGAQGAEGAQGAQGAQVPQGQGGRKRRRTKKRKRRRKGRSRKRVKRKRRRSRRKRSKRRASRR